jgi:aminoglycoside phosphotransferase family enzyme
MRRMPAARRLSTLVRSGADVCDGLRQVAHRVAAFHARADTSTEIAASATRESVLANWEQNFEQMEPFIGGVLDAETALEVEMLVRRYLNGRRALFDRRIALPSVHSAQADGMTG